MSGPLFGVLISQGIIFAIWSVLTFRWLSR